MAVDNLSAQFHALHRAAQPLVLYNIWDAGSAAAVAASGAAAIATGSASVAAAQGFQDGQKIPLSNLLAVVEQICATVSLPVTVDFEGGYAEEETALASNIAQLLRWPIVGINFEDQIVGRSQLYPPEHQAGRIGAIRSEANSAGIDLFINARTDLFLLNDATAHHEHLDEAIMRAEHYQRAGASGLFIPGIVDASLIKRICDAVQLPVNIMMKPGVPSLDRLTEIGVARVSHGPFPFLDLMQNLQHQAQAALAGSTDQRGDSST